MIFLKKMLSLQIYIIVFVLERILDDKLFRNYDIVSYFFYQNDESK